MPRGPKPIFDALHPIDGGRIAPDDQARQRLAAALQEYPAGLQLVGAACALIDPDHVARLRQDIGRRVHSDVRTAAEKNAANILLGALLDNEPVCELRSTGFRAVWDRFSQSLRRTPLAC
jgi:hypothetical protein